MSWLSLLVSPVRSCWLFPYAAATILLHVLIYHGVLNVHFTSPVVGPVPRLHRADVAPPARRVFLFVIDGLRARTLFDGRLGTAPFLRDVVERRGAWGVSHARTPTLSRPGHLSLVSGVYEYMHGLTRPPSENPFDSVFNRSSAAWLFGEHEITQMFVGGSVGEHVHSWYYPPSTNDFSMRDPALLDQLVFNHLSDFLRRAEKDPAGLGAKLRGPRVVLMFHMLGVDTFSHSHATSGEGLRLVIAAVDRGIRKAEKEAEKFFGDARTAFLLSADHGMAEWSGHGAGNTLDETMTPLVAWGAGIRGPEPSTGPKAWGVASRRLDVAQVDICPLMAALVGANFPAHSVGRLPTGLLNASAVERARMLRANALQTFEQFLVLRGRVRAHSMSLTFREAPGLSPESGRRRLGAADEALAAGRSAEAETAYGALLDDSVRALSFFHAFHAPFCLSCVAALLFLAPLSYWLASQRPGAPPLAGPGPWEAAVVGGGLALLLLFLLADGRPPLHYAYGLLVVYAAWGVYRALPRLAGLAPARAELLRGLACAAGAALLVASFFWRPAASLAALLHLVVDLWAAGREARATTSARIFVLGSLALAAFPLLPGLGRAVSFPVVYLGAGLTAAVLAPLLRRWPRPAAALLAGQLLMLLLACWNHFRVHASVRAGDGMPWAATVVTKVLLLLSAAAVGAARRLGGNDAVLVSVWVATVTGMTLFSLYLETLLLATLAVTQGAWLALHRGLPAPHYLQPWPDKAPLDGPGPTARPEAAALAHAYGYVLYLYLGLYGIGNIPTISSYDPHAVLCFRAVFDLAVMALVVFLKDVIPIVLSTCHLQALLVDANAICVYRNALVFLDAIGLFFLASIHEADPWTTFATSVNHFTTSMLFIAFVSPLFPLCRLVTAPRS